MSNLIRDSIRAGCASLMGNGSFCPYPECECSDYSDMPRALEVAARHLGEAIREKAAKVIDDANKTGPYQAIGAAKVIRAISIGDDE